MDTIQLHKWDSAEHLNSDEDMIEYLNACLEEAGNDPLFIAKALGIIVRARGMTKIADNIGIPRENLYRELSGNTKPEFGTILKVITALGLNLHAIATTT